MAVSPEAAWQPSGSQVAVWAGRDSVVPQERCAGDGFVSEEKQSWLLRVLPAPLLFFPPHLRRCCQLAGCSHAAIQ